jgi:hypothetical protein
MTQLHLVVSIERPWAVAAYVWAVCNLPLLGWLIFQRVRAAKRFARIEAFRYYRRQLTARLRVAPREVRRAVVSRIPN